LRIARWPGGFQVRGLLLAAQVVAVADAAIVEGRCTLPWRLLGLARWIGLL
jgi:hypothetical protein